MSVRNDFDLNKTITIDDTIVHFDEINQRVKILGYNKISVKTLRKIINYSSNKKVGKIISNCFTEDWENFIESGFELEGFIDGFYKGKVALCMSYFVDKDRKKFEDRREKDLIIKKCLEEKRVFSYENSEKNFLIRNAKEQDVKGMVELFTEVFSSYPSPVYDEDYLRKNMKDKCLYKIAILDEKIVGIVSADMDFKNLNAEITDCATNPNYRCKGITSNIIFKIEKDLESMGFKTLYSLSRAVNIGINRVFSKHNYVYNGRLINNCNICGAFEDMNIWVKTINK